VLLLVAPATALAQPKGRLSGRVWERGSLMTLPQVRVSSTSGEEAATDAEGRFDLELSPGVAELVMIADGFEPLRVKENITAGQGLKVEYYLRPLATRRLYQSTVRAESRREGERFSLKAEELRQLPGASGDPFRAIGLMPGVATPLPLLPFYVIRGASPGTNGFFLDGMRVPQLFHFMLGGGVINGRLVDRLDFYPGAYDVSFGRYAGGVIDSETRAARGDGQHMEVELRLYDLSAMGEFKLPKGVRLVVAGHYGFPGVILKAIDPRIDLHYADYQLRLDWRGLTVEALGSWDKLSISREVERMGALARVPADTRLEFHRIQIRERDRVKNAELEAALVGGIDDMATFGGQGVRKLSLAWRFNARATWRLFRLFVGTDGELSRFTAESFGRRGTNATPDELGELAGDRNGVVAGLFVQGTLVLLRNRLNLTAGVRVDAYHANQVTLLGIDPRFSVKAKLQPWLTLNGGIGLYQQPPSFPIPLPGIDTFALQLGLQRAWQGAVGIETRLPQNLTFTATGFYQKFYNVNDVSIDDFGPTVCAQAPPPSLTGLPAAITRQTNGQSYGMELLLRRNAGRFTGWIAYTLSRSERVYACGLRPADFDQSHLLNVVAQVRLPRGVMLGGRLYVSTGRPVTVIDPDRTNTVRNNFRLPDYVQFDLRVDKEWLFKRWAFALFVEILNITFSQSVFGIHYHEKDGVLQYDEPQINGFRWILPSIGIRGRF
jgi:hypothetical protein